MAPTNSDYYGPDKIIEKKREYLFPCAFHFYKKPPQIISASGTVMIDSLGKKYIDFFAGVSVMNCGHCNREINQAVMEQMETLQHTTSIYLTQPVVELAERLAAVLPGNISRSFFCNSGSEANEGAMLLARLHTGRREFIALTGSLHGRTFLTAGATEIPMWRTDPFLQEVPVHFARNAGEVVSVLDQRGPKIAALIVEPIQGNGGIRPLESDFFELVGPKLKETGTLLISDEIQTGFARTGKMFAIEHHSQIPDIITGAKALGNGFPIGFFASTPEVAASLNRPSASTLGGNPVSCRAALAVLDFIEKENLISRAAGLGKILKKELSALSNRHKILGDVRGIGLMVGVNVKAIGKMDSAEVTDLILEQMKDKGFLIGKNGLDRNVLAFQPPLVISEKEIEDMIKALEHTLCEIDS